MLIQAVGIEALRLVTAKKVYRVAVELAYHGT